MIVVTEVIVTNRSNSSSSSILTGRLVTKNTTTRINNNDQVPAPLTFDGGGDGEVVIQELAHLHEEGVGGLTVTLRKVAQQEAQQTRVREQAAAD